MDWRSVVPVFHVLVRLHFALAYVAPPTNVTFHCHNLHNELRWHYGHLQQGLRFKVIIKGQYSSEQHRWVDPPALHADVSFLSHQNRDSYFLQVAAVIGGNESDPSEGIMFSYFQDSFVERKCLLDLPPVNVTALRDAKISFKFIHPWLLYFNPRPNTRTRKRKSDLSEADMEDTLPDFDYKVTMEQISHDLTCDERVCEEELPVTVAQQKHCLKIVGEMNNIKVRGPESYCTAPFKETKLNNTTIYAVLIPASIGVVVAFIFFMVYMKRTRPSSPLPFSLINSKTQHIFPVQPEEITVPRVEPTSPTPLLYHEEEEFPTTIIPDNTDIRMPMGLPLDEGVCDVSDEPNADDAGYSLKDLDLDEKENSDQSLSAYEVRPEPGYERRPVLVKLAPDERNEGYRG